MSSIEGELGALQISGVTPDELLRLYDAARTVLPNAHAPYSNFPVAAALLADDGQIYVGVNVENAAYPLGTCAERQAVGTAVTAGARTFRAIVIVTATEETIPPCGSCRQVLREFSKELPIVLSTPAGRARSLSLSQLLPESFGPEDLLPPTS